MSERGNVRAPGGTLESLHRTDGHLQRRENCIVNPHSRHSEVELLYVRQTHTR